MKNNKTLVIIALIFLNVIAGYIVFTGTFGGASKFDKCVEKAQQYQEQKLYAKSVEKYDEALSIKKSTAVCIAKIDVMDEGVEYGELSNSADIDTILEEMLMYGREAQRKTRIASPATIPKSGERNRKIHSCMLYLISI